MHLTIIRMPLIPDYIHQNTNHFFVLFDIFVLYVPFILLQKIRNWSVLIPFTLLSLIVLFNVGYSRYFHTYVPLSLYTATENLNGLSSNIFDAFEISDIILLFNLIITYLCYFTIYKKVTFEKSRYWVIFLTSILLIIYFAIFISKTQKERLRLAEHFKEQKDSRTLFAIAHETMKGELATDPATGFFHHGLIINHILSNINNKQQPFPDKLRPFVYSKQCHIDSICREKNLIFILVESLASFVVNKKYDSTEITPCINKLLRGGAIYRNMKCETKLGESSDGQMIYMTGLLPINNQVTIYNLANDSVISLCHLLKKQTAIKETRMVIPTGNTAWSQKRMCEKYGFDSLYSRENYKDQCEDWLTDEQLFKYAAKYDKPIASPFFSMILTSSTHSPWNKKYESINIKFPNTYSNELKCYLTNIHYMDHWLGWYIKSLKEKNLYDNSILIIAADHKPNIPKLNVKNAEDFNDIPIIIVNSSINDNYFEKDGICQSSIFPTILDMFGIKNKWRGVGTSMFTPKENRQTEREKKKHIISEAIIMSDFFNSANKAYTCN